MELVTSRATSVQTDDIFFFNKATGTTDTTLTDQVNKRKHN
jgi:hypothetical protein